ncbi:MAG: molybdenum ABC transporter ATP-binding protein [Myxococcota bacterium]
MSAEGGEIEVGLPLEVRARIVLSDFTLEVDERIEARGVTAIFGPSGSGKTTLLRAIAGFERPARGRIALGERVFSDAEAGEFVPPHLRPIGFLFQDARLFDHLDVAGNLDFGARRRGRGDARFASGDVIASLDLAPLLPRRVDGLSGGERQRVALARTLLSGPELLLLDEPLSALDAARKAEILPYLETVTRRFGIPTLFVSHDLDDVVRLADRVLVLDDGQIAGEGPTAAVVEGLDRPSVAERGEASVVLEGRVLRHDARLHLTLVDLHGDTVSLPLAERLEEGDPVRLRVLARDVAIAVTRPEGLSIRNVLAGRVTSIRDQGAGAADVTIQLREDHLRARLTRAAVEELVLTEGRDVFALVKSVSLDRGR